METTTTRTRAKGEQCADVGQTGEWKEGQTLRQLGDIFAGATVLEGPSVVGALQQPAWREHALRQRRGAVGAPARPPQAHKFASTPADAEISVLHTNEAY